MIQEWLDRHDNEVSSMDKEVFGHLSKAAEEIMIAARYEKNKEGKFMMKKIDPDKCWEEVRKLYGELLKICT